jgi:hypothetical protein
MIMELISTTWRNVQWAYGNLHRSFFKLNPKKAKNKNKTPHYIWYIQY